jgi:hypothetical protein
MGKGRRRRGDSDSEQEELAHKQEQQAAAQAAVGAQAKGRRGGAARLRAGAGAGAGGARLPASAFVSLQVDPARVRFAHSRVRPVFSGCGRRLEETLQLLRDKRLAPEKLPTITVIEGPPGADGEPWFFSLNNRRLWVLKQAHKEGLLVTISVRARGAKSHELERYTLQKCALEATLMRERCADGYQGGAVRDDARDDAGDERERDGGGGGGGGGDDDDDGDDQVQDEETRAATTSAKSAA